MFVDDQRGLQHKVVDPRTSDTVADVQRQLHHRRARHQHDAVHLVIRQPRMGRERQPAGEDGHVRICLRHHRPQQRVLACGDAETACVDQSRPKVHPIPLPLESVGGQFDPPRRRAVEDTLPVGRLPVYVGFGGRHQQPAHTAFVTSQRRDHTVVVAIILQ